MNNSFFKALKYILCNIHFFDVSGESSKNEEIKPFIELVFCYNMLADQVKLLSYFEDIKLYAEKQILNGTFEKKFINNVDALAGIAIMEEFCLKKNTSFFRDILIHYVESKKIDKTLERTPFRVMDLKYSLNKANIKDNLETYESIYENTILGKNLSPYYLTPMSVYSITHTIFYLTDMGRKDDKNSVLLEKKSLLKLLISENIIRKDLDILGELLLCCFFLNLENDSEFVWLIDYSIQCILNSQSEDGSFPAPVDNNYLNKRKRFDERYHTTLVCIGALAWCMNTKK